VLAGLELVGGGSEAAPAGFVSATSRAAALFASAGGRAAGLDSEVAALAEAGLNSLGRSWTRVVGSVALAVGVLGVGVTALTLLAWADGAPLSPVPLPQPAVAAPAAEKPMRLDRHGDPLPGGALLLLGTLRWRATGDVETLAWSPDGKAVAAASRREVSVFDLAGRLTKQIRFTDASRSFFLEHSANAFSPDGRRLACRCMNQEGTHAGKPVVRLLDLATTRTVQEFPADGVIWLGWSADGEPLAVSLDRRAVVLRELAAGRERRFDAENLPDPRLAPTGCAYAVRGRLLALFDWRGTVHVWDTSTGKRRHTLDTKNPSLFGLAISADGRMLAAGVLDDADKRAVQVWDVPAGKITHTLAADQKSLHGVAFSPDGRTLATVSWFEVRFHDPATGRERGRVEGATSIGHNVAFAPDGRTLATAEVYSPAVHLRDVPSGTLRPAPEGHGDSPTSIAFAPDGTRVATAGSADGRVFVWDAKTGEPVARVQSRESARSCAFSADGRSVFVFRTGEHLDVADAGTGRTVRTLKVKDPDQPGVEHSGLTMVLSDDRKTLVGVSTSPRDEEGGEGDLLITGWDAETHKQLFRRRPPVGFWPVVSPDARFLAFAHRDERSKVESVPGVGPVHLEDLRTGERVLDLPELIGQTGPVAFSCDGRLLVTFTSVYVPDAKVAGAPGRMDRTVRLWELASGQEVLALAAPNNARAAFSADHRRLALAGSDRDVVLWDLRRGREVRRFRGFDCEVRSLAFSPDGSRVVSGLVDSTLLVWDATLPKEAEAGPPGPGALERAWADLAGAGPKAFAARGTLAGWPAEAVAFLRGRLKPVSSADPALLRRLIADLDSETFAVREKARAELEELGERASGALVEALGGKPSLEARRRMEALLGRQRGLIRDAETLPAVRAVAVLEDIGTPEARAVLKTLAGGLQAARQTQEARTALERASRGRK
jgi:WD40 repeat protein